MLVIIFLSFIISKIIRNRLLIQPLLPGYHFFYGATGLYLHNSEGELDSKIELVFGIFEGTDFQEAINKPMVQRALRGLGRQM